MVAAALMALLLNRSAASCSRRSQLRCMDCMEDNTWSFARLVIQTRRYVELPLECLAVPCGLATAAALEPTPINDFSINVLTECSAWVVRITCRRKFKG